MAVKYELFIARRCSGERVGRAAVCQNITGYTEILQDIARSMERIEKALANKQHKQQQPHPNILPGQILIRS